MNKCLVKHVRVFFYKQSRYVEIGSSPVSQDQSNIFNKQMPIAVMGEKMKKKRVSNKKEENEQEDLFDYSQLED